MGVTQNIRTLEVGSHNPTSGVYLKEWKSICGTDSCVPFPIVTLLIVVKVRNQPPSVQDQIETMWDTHSSAMKKSDLLSFATELSLEDITLGEVSQKQKEKYCMLSVVSASYKCLSHGGEQNNGPKSLRR